MKILKLEESGRRKALELAQRVLRDSYDEKSAAAAASFLEKRFETFSSKGVYEDDDLKAFIVYDGETYQIFFLCVRKDEQNKGYGTALVDALRREASALRLARIKVNAPDAMIAFYQNYGFEQAGHETGENENRVMPMEYLLGREYIGKTVTVIVDRPYGSFHPHHPDVLYPVNYGYVNELIDGDGEFQDAYVYGPQEPLESFKGTVAGIVYHKDGPSRFIVTRTGETVDPKRIIETLAFEDQYYDTRFVWHHELN
ncbi:MAG: GNAT family N-acetyltransferase [Solobacterium sp.]|nr:GNAT family N-acetyltransferase [Solobacterium sp.]